MSPQTLLFTSSAICIKKSKLLPPKLTKLNIIENKTRLLSPYTQAFVVDMVSKQEP